MRVSRSACTALAVLALVSGACRAQPYPAKSIRLVVPAAPGTGSDYFARTVGQALAEGYRQQVVVDNRAGAGGLIGAALIAAATPDGYTVGMASTSLVVSPLLQAKPPYRPVEDFAPIAQFASITSVLAVAPGIAARTAQEFVALARSKPGQLNFPSVGTGTASHLTAEVFNRAAGIDAVHVPFKGMGDLYTEMLANRVHYFVFVAPAVTGLARDGKVRALAVTSAKRSAAFPDVPTVHEVGLPGAELDTMFGLVGPAAMPRAVVERLHADIVAILRRPDTKERFERQGGEPATDTTPAAYGRRLRAEYERYRRLLPEIGLKPQ